jgi:DNA topoisomerase-1
MALISTIRYQNQLGSCPKCEIGNLSIIKSQKSGKRFVGCSGYREGCNASSPLPQKGIISVTNRKCPICKWPIIHVKNGKLFWNLCINIKCESKLKKGNKKYELSIVQ